MGIRFRKSIRLGKGVKLNLSKGGVGISVGTKGMRIGVGPRGIYRSVGIPGTGIYAIDYMGGKSGSKRKGSSAVSETKEVKTFDIPMPQELNLPKYPWMILLVGIISIFIQPIIGLILLLASLFLNIRIRKSELFNARREFLSAVKFLKNEDIDKALESLQHVSNFNSNIPIVNYLKAILHFEKEEFDKSVHEFSKYLESNPDDIDTQIKYAIALSKTGKSEAAIKILQGFPPETKEDLNVIIALGICFLELEKPELAVQILEKGPTRSKKMDEQMMLFRYLLGTAYKKTGQNKKAINQLRKIYVEDINYKDVEEQLKELGAIE